MSQKLKEKPLPPAAKIRGGVRVPHKKETAESETIRMPAPPRVILPMIQHIGVPCVPLVKVGDYVCVGEVVGDSESYVSAPIHASVSGRVSAITEVELPGGIRSEAVQIDSDGYMKLHEFIEPPVVHTREDFLRAVRDSGLVGLGGAGFPAHVKMKPPQDREIDTLIVNAAECEPYITVDYRECMEHPLDILGGIYTVKELLGIPKVIIAVEDNKPAAIEILSRIAADEADRDNSVRVMKLKSRYPQGAEKVLVYAATNRRIPMGGLPGEVGCLVMNVSSVGFISRYLRTGRPLITRSLTIDGTAIASPKNVRVPIGTPIRDVIEFAGGYKKTPKKILMGGPMMGLALPNDELPILKNNNAILAFDRDFCKKPETRACIRCGRCAMVCPMNLTPTAIEKYEKTKDLASLEKTQVTGCMECGSCSFICPSARPLVQSIRLAKTMLKNAK